MAFLEWSRAECCSALGHRQLRGVARRMWGDEREKRFLGTQAQAGAPGPHLTSLSSALESFVLCQDLFFQEALQAISAEFWSALLPLPGHPYTYCMCNLAHLGSVNSSRNLYL